MLPRLCSRVPRFLARTDRQRATLGVEEAAPSSILTVKQDSQQCHALLQGTAGITGRKWSPRNPRSLELAEKQMLERKNYQRDVHIHLAPETPGLSP